MSWELNGKRKTSEFPLTIQKDPLGKTLKLLQGARLITDLESQAVTRGDFRMESPLETSPTHKLLEDLSREYGLASRAMALCAVHQRIGDVAGQLPKTRIVPIGLPQDLVMEAYFESARYSRPSARIEQCIRQDAPEVICCCLMPPECLPISDKIPSRQPDEFDLLVKLSSHLEPDGGMPGKDLEERLLASLIALIVFYQEGNTCERGVFRLHIHRLVAFLQSASLDSLNESSQVLVRETLKAVDQEETVSGNWRELAENFVLGRKMKNPKAWEKVRQYLQNDR